VAQKGAYFYALKVTDLGVNNVSIASDIMSVSTNSSDESVLRSVTAVPPLRGKEGGESHVVNSAAEGAKFESDRDWSNSSEHSSVEGLQNEPKRQRVVDTMSYFENDLNAIGNYLVSECKDVNPLSILPPDHSE